MKEKVDAVIVGAGPCGLFQVFELGLLGMTAHVVDALPNIGGQCFELYPDKPIYDIPGIPVCSAMELVDRLLEQIKPFDPVFHLDQQVTELSPTENNRFNVRTGKDVEFDSAAVVIAGGVGSFQPRALRIQGVERFVDKQVFYRVQDVTLFRDRDVVVLGGGDSALDWAVELVEDVRSLTLVHRSKDFRAAEATVERMKQYVADDKMRFMVGNATDLTVNDNRMTEVHITQPNREVERLSAEYLLVFFGLSPRLGPIATWDLGLQRNQVITDTEKFETNIPGIYAIGDIAVYPGKKKLILSGFHEAALAAFAIKERLNPGEKVHLQYTTTSTLLQERLGVSNAERN
ncbi:MAG: NAD(P)/FAD-dependent oxidoreductase [Gammaproteobacteria bacterium]|nr:NAD(P)/FAD-dependent oxidoreductase [Gammaproteobacteria bacterium]MYD80420.1 NAD(P)/FAD-dependent oxidoreductase [Gammaproteobacteria bacterium]